MIEVNKLNKTYDRRTRAANTVLHDVTVSLPDKGFVCILGPSGCGKTSLLNAIGGLDKFDSGSVTIDGHAFTRCGQRAFELERDRNFGYIFQNYYLLGDHSVAYNVYLGLHSLGLSHAEKLQRVRKALRAVGMERFLRRNVAELSGGQQQRVAIARALARQPRVIFADEPTGNLDEDNTRAVCSLLRAVSKDSLVVMVTHEESIARLFADRIVTLSDGRVTSDTTGWERRDMALSSGSTIYTGELRERQIAEGSVTLRLFEEPGAAPASVTVAVLRDRIVLKVADGRAAVLGRPEDPPKLVEGPRPSVDPDKTGAQSQELLKLFQGKKADAARPGKGLTGAMMVRQAWSLRKDGKLRRTGTAAFLILLTVFALVLTGDFIYLSRVDPEEFLTSDPHMLSVKIQQGSAIKDVLDTPAVEFANALDAALTQGGFSYDFIPPISVICEYQLTTYYQTGQQLSVRFPSAMAYAPLERLDPGTLLYGRMPEKNYEIVVDRQVLEAMLEQESLVLNSIRDIRYFLGTTMEVSKHSYPLVICGICDSGARTVYISRSAMLALCSGSVKAMALDEFKALFPGEYDDLTLGPEECLVNPTVTGVIWEERIGQIYRPGGRGYYTVRGLFHMDDTHFATVLSDEALKIRLMDMMTGNYQIYCTDKAAALPFIQDFINGYDDPRIAVTVTDRYELQRQEFERAATLRMDARSIVTLTVLALCLVMLYLLSRAQVRERIGLVAVYRLLGIPGRKLCAIFLLEALLSALAAVVPSALLTWAVMEALHKWTSYAASILLPIQAAALTGLGIVAYYLLVSVLPLFPLLRLPPAQLAAKYE